MSSYPPGRPDRLFYSPVPERHGTHADVHRLRSNDGGRDFPTERPPMPGEQPGGTDRDANREPASAGTDPEGTTGAARSRRSVRTDGSGSRRSATNDGSKSGPSVLVVGETVPGLVLAALLERGAASPTLVTRRRNDSGATSAVTLAAPATRTVDGLGDGPPLAEFGIRVDEIAVVDGENRTTYAVDGAGDSPLRVDRTRLLARLRRSVARSNRRRGQVERIRRVGDGVEVAFGDDDRATYDLVVGADGPNSFLGTLTGNPRDLDAGVHEWTFGVDRPPGWSGDLVEFWNGDALLTATPFGDDLAVRLGVAADGARDRLPSDLADDALADLGGPVADAVGDALPDPADYRRVPEPTADPTWRVGRVAFCGDAATPLGPLSVLAPSIGIEDAVALAGSLSATDSVDDALERYGSRRAGRLSGVFEAATAALDRNAEYPPTSRDGALGTVAGLRTLGNARFLGGTDPMVDGNWSPGA